MERKATCYRRLTTAGTLRSESLPQLPQVPGASLWCWEVMTGGAPFQLPTFPVYSALVQFSSTRMADWITVTVC